MSTDISRDSKKLWTPRARTCFLRGTGGPSRMRVSVLYRWRNYWRVDVYARSCSGKEPLFVAFGSWSFVRSFIRSPGQRDGPVQLQELGLQHLEGDGVARVVHDKHGPFEVFRLR